MFCPKCGTQVDDDKMFCPKCGNKLHDSEQDTIKKVEIQANSVFNDAERQMGTAIKDVKNSIDGNDNVSNGRLKEDRGLLSYILLTIITCGIYSYYFIYQMAHDVNIACEGDGESTGGLVQYILLSIVTCGIYSLWWEYKLGNRLASNAPRYGLSFQENGTTILMWALFGSLVCGLGPWFAMNIMIKNSNAICIAYNKKHGL